MGFVADHYAMYSVCHRVDTRVDNTAYLLPAIGLSSAECTMMQIYHITCYTKHVTSM